MQVGVTCDVLGGGYVWLMPGVGAWSKSPEAVKEVEEVRRRRPAVMWLAAPLLPLVASR